MVEAARDDGIDFVMTTAYRSYAFQTILWNNAVTRYGSEEAANNMVARPGESEHQSGLDVDISSSENNYQLNENFGDTEAGKWVSANAADYGFVLRYPSDKTDITGYGFEPWHLRYVGETAAKEITEQGLALEEYVEQLQDEGIL
jgi:D-alanyl-D-alanine carboxypeptidase